MGSEQKGFLNYQLSVLSSCVLGSTEMCCSLVLCQTSVVANWLIFDLLLASPFLNLILFIQSNRSVELSRMSQLLVIKRFKEFVFGFLLHDDQSLVPQKIKYFWAVTFQTLFFKLHSSPKNPVELLHSSLRNLDIRRFKTQGGVLS